MFNGAHIAKLIFSTMQHEIKLLNIQFIFNFMSLMLTRKQLLGKLTNKRFDLCIVIMKNRRCKTVDINSPDRYEFLLGDTKENVKFGIFYHQLKMYVWFYFLYYAVPVTLTILIFCLESNFFYKTFKPRKYLIDNCNVWFSS